MTTETTAQEVQTVATTVEKTILQMSPEIIAALATSDPQAAAVAAVVDVAIQILANAAKQLATSKTSSAQMVKLMQQTADSVQQTHEAWAKFAASEGEPEHAGGEGCRTVSGSSPFL